MLPGRKLDAFERSAFQLHFYRFATACLAEHFAYALVDMSLPICRPRRLPRCFRIATPSGEVQRYGNLV